MRNAVRQQGNQQGDGAADGQRRQNAEGLVTLLLHRAQAGVVLPTTADALQDRRAQ